MKQLQQSKRIILCLAMALVLVAAYAMLGNHSKVHAESATMEEAKITQTEFTFDDNFCPGSLYVPYEVELDKVEVGDSSIVKVLYYTPLEREDDEEDLNNRLSSGGYNYLEFIPLKAGTTTVRMEGYLPDSGMPLVKEYTVTVKDSYFQAFLNKYKSKLGIVYTYEDSHGDLDVRYSSNLFYGDSSATVYGRYGLKATIKFAGKTKSATCSTDNRALIKGLKAPVKLGTKGTVTVTFGSAKVTKSFKVVSKTFIGPNYIKKNAKKGKFVVYNLNKGDVIKVKVGKKTLKTVKIKKKTSSKYYTFKSKKKLKKNTKVKYYVYNKYKQKMATTTYKVASEGYYEED